MIALDPSLGYIHEPFNILTRPGISEAPVCDGFTYVAEHNEGLFAGDLSRTLSFRYNVGAEIASMRSMRDVGRGIRDSLRTYSYRHRGLRPLMKDPMALLSAEWLAGTFDMDVVITMRHPFGFAGSLKKLGWNYDFNSFLLQDELMSDKLEGFRDEITRFAEERHDTVEQGALLWKLQAHVIDTYRHTHSDWIVVRHEDLAHEPLDGFRMLYAQLGLEFGSGVADKILASSAASNPISPASDPTHNVRRDSRAQVSTWRQRLTDEETSRIECIIGDQIALFYDDVY